MYLLYYKNTMDYCFRTFNFHMPTLNSHPVLAKKPLTSNDISGFLKYTSSRINKRNTFYNTVDLLSPM